LSVHFPFGQLLFESGVQALPVVGSWQNIGPTSQSSPPQHVFV